MALPMGDVKLLNGFPIVDETNFGHFARPMSGPAGCSDSGYIPRDKERFPLGSQQGTTRMPPHLVMTLEDLKHKCSLQATRRERLSDLCKEMPQLFYNQSPTNSCWCFGPVHGVTIAYARANKTFQRLSPYSVSGPINGYRDVGGWGSACLKFMVNEGIASDILWPFSKPGMSSAEINAANRKAITGSRSWYEPSRADAATRKVQEAWDLQTWEEKLTCLYLGLPVPDGYNYEGHETCSIDAHYDEASDTFWVLDVDSYTKDGTLHARYRKGKRMGLGDDPIAIRVSLAAAA